MAQLALVLGVPSGDHALEASTANVRRVLIPAGTRHLLITCEAPIFIEEDVTQSKADAAAAGTARQKFSAATFSYRPKGSGCQDDVITVPRSIYVQGTAVSQVIWITAVEEAA